MSIALCNSFQCLIPQSEVLAVLTFSGSNRNSLLHTPEVHRCQIEPRKNSSVYENIVFIHVCKRKWSSMSGKGHPALVKLEFTAMSTFSPVGSLSSNCMRMCVCVCVCVDGMNLKYVLRWHIHMYISSFRTMPVQTHAHTHLQIIWGQRTDGAKSGYCRIYTLHLSDKSGVLQHDDTLVSCNLSASHNDQRGYILFKTYCC